ncbi:MAG: alkyl sulfatase BDS1-like metallo-beta-lactamase superfamily hydrolase [Paraglaciecola sp.]|jgi:alkyl sulfatase BDS1-like metallo-beta-lactamase superfamily hydrolase
MTQVILARDIKEKSMLNIQFTISLTLLALLAGCEQIQYSTDAKPASTITQEQQALVRESLPFDDTLDFELSEKGLIKRPEQLEILDDNGKVVWELGNYDFLTSNTYHNTINPSLERQARLNMSYGLYQVTDRIYQVRGYDLSNISFIKGDTGWIIFDPLLTPATSKAAFALVTQELGAFPVKAVVYSHAHADHFGGVKGVVSQAQVDSGAVQIVAPKDFMEHAIKENILAGNAMTRRASYQYGSVLEKSPTGQVDAAIGKGLSSGYIGLIAPTKIIQEDIETLIIDGITMVMQNTPSTESPAEMNTYFPQFKTLWMAENVTGTLHNVYTLRGAEVRDALGWSKFINHVIFGFAKDAEVMFASHSWPRWGNKYLIEVLEKQRDMYGFLHDRTLNLANKGVTINEIHNELNVPDALSKHWYNRGYHGSYSHNVRGIINKYLGFFDMNPANLDKLSPTDSAPRYLKAMGGADNVLSLAQQAFDKGEYRWGAELLNNLIFAMPTNTQALLLQADIFEQMGYQAESAGWRNTYLSGAWELRNGVSNNEASTQAGPEMIQAMSSEMLFNLLGVKLNIAKALNKALKINIIIPDRQEKFALELKNSHLNNIQAQQFEDPIVTVTINRRDLDQVLMKTKTFKQLIASNQITFDGDANAFFGLMQMMEDFPFWFNIATP